MKTRLVGFVRLVALAAPLASIACGGAASGGAPANGAANPLVGTWTFHGDIPNSVDATLTLGADESFTLVEVVAPLTTPAGAQPANGCKTTDTYVGTYDVRASSGEHVVAWMFTGGTSNAVVGCADASQDAKGQPMTSADVAAYADEGLAPPASDAYSVTSTQLVLTSTSDATNGAGFAGTLTFDKSP